VSSSFGQFDLAGFPKAPAFWFRQQWLSAIPASDAGRPPIAAPAAATTVRVVENWAPGTDGGLRTINVYTNAPAARLRVNGAVLPNSTIAVKGGVATWRAVVFAAGTLTADALAADNATVLASHTRASWGAGASLALSLDAPSLATGTGAALFLDGADVALVRATVLDAAGVACASCVDNVTFAVTEGPGLVVGCGNGDPANQDPNDALWRPAYHGLARAVVRVTLDGATPDAVRARRAAIELDAGKGPRASAILPVGATPPTRLVVTASAPGMATATIVIPLSVAPADAPLAVAAASVALADISA